MSNKKYFGWTIVLFIVFVGILFYSYIYKLGYLKIATFIFLVLIPIILLLNLSNRKNTPVSTCFWLALLFMFLFALIDKILRIHIFLSQYVSATEITSDPVLVVSSLYVIAFILVVSLFYRLLIRDYKQDSGWIKLFIFALLMKVIGVVIDHITHDTTEDYFELFSVYFFSAAFLLKYLKMNKIKRS